MGLFSRTTIEALVCIITAGLVVGCSSSDDSSGKKNKISASTLEAMDAYSKAQVKLSDVGCSHDFIVQETSSTINYSANVNCGTWAHDAGNSKVLPRTDDTITIFLEIIDAGEAVVAATDAPHEFRKEAEMTMKVLNRLMNNEFEPLAQEHEQYEDPAQDQAAYIEAKSRMEDLGAEFTKEVRNGSTYYGVVSSNVVRDTPEQTLQYIEAATEFAKAAIRFGSNKRADKSELKGEAKTLGSLVKDDLIPNLEESYRLQVSLLNAREAQEALEALSSLTEALEQFIRNNP